MQKYTKVSFMLLDDKIVKYFEGQPKFWQIRNIIGELQILDIEKVNGNFQADYIKSKTLSGYSVY